MAMWLMIACLLAPPAWTATLALALEAPAAHGSVDVGVDVGTAAQSTKVTFDNTAPRLDTNGSVVNAHDGTIRYVDGWWWLHAASYGAGGCMDPPQTGCQHVGGGGGCGFQSNHNVSIWRSRDMRQGSWEFVGNAVECETAPDCQILYRPHMVWNPNTQLYVLFYNYVARTAGVGSRNGVATSPHPAGPWKIANGAMRTARPHLPSNSNGSVGDFDVLVDTDGKAYMAYSFGPMSIERLDDDYLNAATGEGVNATFPGGPGNPTGTLLPENFVEAPSLWQRNGRYYLTTGHCCCFCWQGSGLIVYHAPHPLGPWTKQRGPAADLGCIPNASNPTPAEAGTLPLTAEVSPGQGCNYKGVQAASVSRAQQNFVFPIATPTGVEYIWTGDRWMQAHDGQKAHEPQFWTPLRFDAHGNVLPFTWVDSFAVDMVLPQPGGPLLEPRT